MIYEARNVKPFITFGLGRTELTIKTGETADIWQSQTLPDGDSNELVTLLKFNKVSDYNFVLLPEEAGVYEIYSSVFKDKENQIASNTVTLTVIV